MIVLIENILKFKKILINQRLFEESQYIVLIIYINTNKMLDL